MSVEDHIRLSGQPPKSSAERVRRFRRRQKGLVCPVSVDLSYTLWVGLIDRGYLTEEDSRDPASRARAVEQFIRDQLNTRFRNSVTA